MKYFKLIFKNKVTDYELIHPGFGLVVINTTDTGAYVKFDTKNSEGIPLVNIQSIYTDKGFNKLYISSGLSTSYVSPHVIELAILSKNEIFSSNTNYGFVASVFYDMQQSLDMLNSIAPHFHKLLTIDASAVGTTLLTTSDLASLLNLPNASQFLFDIFITGFEILNPTAGAEWQFTAYRHPTAEELVENGTTVFTNIDPYALDTLSGEYYNYAGAQYSGYLMALKFDIVTPSAGDQLIVKVNGAWNVNMRQYLNYKEGLKV